MIGIIRYPGSNCDIDTLRFFKNSFYIWHKDSKLPSNLELLVIPGGFAFGDRVYNKATEKYIISPGTMAVNSPVTKLIMEAAKKNIPILGICNGFQILTQLDLLPGRLELNDHKKFISKKVSLNINIEKINYNTNTELYIANSYGKYIVDEDEDKYTELVNNNQIFLKYNEDIPEIGSNYNIAGVSNTNKTIFGMMPHPERNNDKFYDILNKILFQNKIINPEIHSLFETNINNLMNSEHISYKSTKKYLKNMHTKEEWVVQGPGENAGIVDIGDGYCIAIRIESHNHPTFINPYEGAATGVGGIMRDIFTMGARPIGILDFLRFGTNKNSDKLLEGAISGISYYGNCVGVPNIGGDLYRHECYNNNPLVNVGCLGIVKKENIIYGNAKNIDDILIYVGSKTGNEGINGAAMSSKSFKTNMDMKKMADNVQKSDPFLEKLLLEACCEIAELKLAEGMQDMGAGGLLCASYEVVMRAREKIKSNNNKTNFGCDIHINKIPTKYDMEPCNTLISESQERMLIVCKKENKQKILKIFENWDLEYSEIGTINNSGCYSIYNNSNLLYERKMDNIKDISQDWELSYNKLNNDKDLQKVKNKNLWQQYDSTVGNRTLKGPDMDDSYAILDIYENNKKLILTWDKNCNICYNKIKNLGGTPLCLVNCLNYGNPKYIMGDFAHTVNLISEFSKEYNVPVVGGNVSLYNSIEEDSILSTPVILMMGIM